jgi:hypothetical protein
LDGVRGKFAGEMSIPQQDPTKIGAFFELILADTARRCGRVAVLETAAGDGCPLHSKHESKQLTDLAARILPSAV